MRQIIFALFGGILMGLTPTPKNAFYLAWVALIPLWILTIKSKKIELAFLSQKAFLAPFFDSKVIIPFAWGFGYHGLALFWITGVHPMTWMGVPWLASLAIAIFCWLFITFWGAALVVAWSLGMTFFEKLRLKRFKDNFTPIDALLRVLIGTAIWCGLESIWSQGSLWWSSLSYTQSPYNLAILQFGQFSGSSTITALIIAINGLIAEGLIFTNKKSQIAKFSLLVLPITLCFILHLYGSYLYDRPVEKSSKTAIKVGIIQGNIPNEIKLYAEGFRKAIEGYTNGYKILADRGVDAVLTPEGALPFLPSDLMRSPLIAAIREKGVVAWVGAFAGKELGYVNTLYTITGKGDIFSRYHKVNLVPFGEYVPFREIIGGVIKRLSPLDDQQIAGNPNQIFDTPLGRAIVGICYDSAYGEHFRRQTARGGEFIITASNNAHYSKAMPAQHHALDVMRAIETDRWAARATNTGYSAVVDPRGKTLWISRINTYELHVDTIYRRQTQTLYVKWGDWLTVVLLVLGISSWSLRFLYF
ncbi:apolipoprotein N-acyltransferase [Pleurocapsa sp. PCC 7327]|uniref:apolipoprotein N-acyltransferase n=1 Tax=Pleurocapsa sp. PCC 7327 TaxID=118163 RepID=UPI00029FB0FA|nr:apolipoprotein N-acyltransferase [Pleurocapsa sp. PCC 7327]AFY78460.1 apolipoprotein N-acyltransferase [Pleurocapsa sp. PCC 7327]